MRRLSVFLICLLSLSLLGAGPSAAKDKLIISQNASANTLHPLAMILTPEQSIACNIYDGLIDRDPTGKIVPALATKWEQTDPTTWRFHLRKGVKWQSGKPFSADDVIFTFELAKTPINRYKFIAGKIAEVKKIDDFTVDIKTKEPWPVLPDALYQTIFILSKDFCSGKSDAFVAEHPMGTGPYALKEWVRDSHILMEAFKDCWKGAPPIKTVIYKPISNDATRLAGVITGSIDLTTEVPVQNVSLVEKAPKVKVISRPSMRSIFLMMRMNKPDFPTSKLKVRQAMLLGINEEEIAKQIMYGRATVSAQLPPPFVRGYNDQLVRPKYDPVKAKQLLKEAGYPKGFDITLHVPNNRYVMDKEIGVALAQQLSKIGVRVKLVARPKAIHFKEIRAKKLDFMMMGWAEATFDSARFLGSFLKTGAIWNGGEISDPTFDKMLADADAALDLKTRAEKLKKVNKYVFDNVMAISLHYQQDIYGVSKELKGFTPSVRKVVRLHRLSF